MIKKILKNRLIPAARQLYIEERFNCEEIARQLGTSSQNIHNWKRSDSIKGYDWNHEREKFITRKRGLIEETTTFLQDFINRARKDMAEGKEISASRMYILKDFIPFLMQLQKYGEKITIPDESEFTGSLSDLIKSQVSICVQQLYSEGLKTSERIKILKQLATIQKDIQQTELERHLTHIDAKIVSAIIRHFKPDATDDEIIKIYRECAMIAKKAYSDTKKNS